MKKLILTIATNLCVLSTFAQFVERTEMSISGKYEVKMVSSAVMQPVWLKSATGQPYQIVREMTNEEIRSKGRNFGMNNFIDAPNVVSNIVDIPAADITGHAMVFADCDNDMTTFQSSCASLDFGDVNANIKAAYLYWNTTLGAGADYAAYPEISTMRSFAGGTNIGAVVDTNYQTVKFKAPGDTTYSTVTATREYNALSGKVCFADVTGLVKGKQGGMFWVADVHCGIKSGATAGWSLIVVYETPNSTVKTIKFWDGRKEIASGYSESCQFNFEAGGIPVAANSQSYLGIVALDGENFASHLLSNYPENPPYDYLEVKANNGELFKINPFAPGQTAPFAGEPQGSYACYNTNGTLLSANGYDGLSSSRISTWDDQRGNNGNEVMRMPMAVNTFGYDAHHLRMPDSVITANATSLTMTYYAGAQGGTMPILAYMAVDFGTDEIPEKPAISWNIGTPIAENVTATLTQNDSTLTINGSGAMLSFEYLYNGGNGTTTAPWAVYKSGIKTLIIGDSITNIGQNAFSYLSNLRKIVIPETITEIPDDSFESSNAIREIWLNRTTPITPAPKAIEAMYYLNMGEKINVYVPCGTKEAYLENSYWGNRVSATNIYPNPYFNLIETPCEIPNLDIDEDETSTTISWEAISDADGYTLMVFRDAARTDTVAVYHFDASGNLRSTASQTMQYIIPDLTANTPYFFTLEALDASANTLYRSTGSFSTNNTTDIMEAGHTAPLRMPVAYYNLQGIKLPQAPKSGVYIILYDNGTAEKQIRQ